MASAMGGNCVDKTNQQMDSRYTDSMSDLVGGGVRIKEEVHSDDSVVSIPIMYCKTEPQSESERERTASESESPALSENEDEGHSSKSTTPSKKRFKRIIPPDDSSDSQEDIRPPPKKKRVNPVNDDSSSDSSDEIVPPARNRRRKRKSDEIKPKEESPSRRGSNDKKFKTESADEEESSSGSSSESSKGNIEFESSGLSEEGISEKSYTSSEPDEIDRSPKEECLLCRNLQNRDFRFRSRSDTVAWCRCGECKIVGKMRDYDRICCREIKDVVDFLDDEMDDASKKNLCITRHPRFELDVFGYQALQRTRYYRTNFWGNSPGYQACWSFVRWIWNKLGWGQRMVIPACVTSKIKEECGDQGITCFSATAVCEKAKHCKQSQK